MVDFSVGSIKTNLMSIELNTIVKKSLWSRLQVQNTDIICVMLRSLVSSQQGNVENSEKNNENSSY